MKYLQRTGENLNDINYTSEISNQINYLNLISNDISWNTVENSGTVLHRFDENINDIKYDTLYTKCILDSQKLYEYNYLDKFCYHNINGESVPTPVYVKKSLDENVTEEWLQENGYLYENLAMEESAPYFIYYKHSKNDGTNFDTIYIYCPVNDISIYGYIHNYGNEYLAVIYIFPFCIWNSDYTTTNLYIFPEDNIFDNIKIKNDNQNFMEGGLYIFYYSAIPLLYNRSQLACFDQCNFCLSISKVTNQIKRNDLYSHVFAENYGIFYLSIQELNDIFNTLDNNPFYYDQTSPRTYLLIKDEEVHFNDEFLNNLYYHNYEIFINPDGIIDYSKTIHTNNVYPNIGKLYYEDNNGLYIDFHEYDNYNVKLYIDGDELANQYTYDAILHAIYGYPTQNLIRMVVFHYLSDPTNYGNNIYTNWIDYFVRVFGTSVIQSNEIHYTCSTDMIIEMMYAIVDQTGLNTECVTIYLLGIIEYILLYIYYKKIKNISNDEIHPYKIYYPDDFMEINGMDKSHIMQYIAIFKKVIAPILFSDSYIESYNGSFSTYDEFETMYNDIESDLIGFLENEQCPLIQIYNEGSKELIFEY